MLKVPIYRLHNFDSQLVGWITFENGNLDCEPDNVNTLRSIMQQPGFDGKQVVFPNKDPEGWLKLLPYTIHGTYLWAGDVQSS